MKAIVLICLAAIIALELIICLVKAAKGSDFTYYLSRPFGIPMPSMKIGAILRILLIIGATICCVLGIQMLG